MADSRRMGLGRCRAVGQQGFFSSTPVVQHDWDADQPGPVQGHLLPLLLPLVALVSLLIHGKPQSLCAQQLPHSCPVRTGEAWAPPQPELEAAAEAGLQSCRAVRRQGGPASTERLDKAGKSIAAGRCSFPGACQCRADRQRLVCAPGWPLCAKAACQAGALLQLYLHR